MNQTAIIFEDNIITYDTLASETDRVSHLLAGLGVVKGDRVALFLPNVPAFAIAYQAIRKIGAIAVSLNAMLKSDEARFILEDSGAKAVFTTPAMAAEVPMLPGLRILACDDVSLAGLMPEVSADFAASEIAADDSVAILYTSGTTGKPKGAVLTRGNIDSNVASVIDCTDSKEGDRHLCFLPLFHCFGQNFIMNACFRSGGTLVLERRFDPAAIFDRIARHGVTHFYGVPAVFTRLLLAGIGPDRFGDVRYFFSAAATMPNETSAEWLKRFGRPIHEGYGLTETSPFASYNHTTSYRVGSVGAPIDGVEMKIVDENGNALPDGKLGEICIKGPNVMKGYWRNEAATREAVDAEGWFRSGDLGTREADGHYVIVDRLKDMINVSGFKVWPREVEEVLHAHPDIEDCAVASAADPVAGEIVRAFVKIKTGRTVSSDGLKAYCTQKLARYKVPASFVFDVEIPRNPSGKILKRVLRQYEPKVSA